MTRSSRRTSPPSGTGASPSRFQLPCSVSAKVKEKSRCGGLSYRGRGVYGARVGRTCGRVGRWRFPATGSAAHVHAAIAHAVPPKCWFHRPRVPHCEQSCARSVAVQTRRYAGLTHGAGRARCLRGLSDARFHSCGPGQLPGLKVRSPIERGATCEPTSSVVAGSEGTGSGPREIQACKFCVLRGTDDRLVLRRLQART